MKDRIWAGGHAYVRNLAGAEQAILRGQFNLAKVLRAAAHSQRVQAMDHGRVLVKEMDPAALLHEIVTELEDGPFDIEGAHNHAVAKLERGYSAGMTPSCCISPISSIFSHSSTIFPSEIRTIPMVRTLTCLPVAGIPIISPF